MLQLEVLISKPVQGTPVQFSSIFCTCKFCACLCYNFWTTTCLSNGEPDNWEWSTARIISCLPTFHATSQPWNCHSHSLLPINGFPASAIASGEVSALAHECWNHTMESGALVAEPFFSSAKSTEILCKHKDKSHH